MNSDNEKMLTTLRASYSGLNGIDPDGKGYKALCKLLDSLSDEMLTLISEADIKFVSPLAINRCARRGIVAPHVYGDKNGKIANSNRRTGLRSND